MIQSGISRKTLQNFNQISKVNYSSQMAKNVSTGFSLQLHHMIKQQLQKAENEARLNHLKLLNAKEKKLQIEKQQEQKRQSIEKQLLIRQQKTMKNLQELKQNQRKEYIRKSNKFKQMQQKLHQKSIEEYKNVVQNYQKQNQAMLNFYQQNKNKKLNHYLQLQLNTKRQQRKTQPLNKYNILDNQQFYKSVDGTNKKYNEQKQYQHTLKKNQNNYNRIKNQKKQKIKKAQIQKEIKHINQYAEKMDQIQNIRNMKASTIMNKQKIISQTLPHIRKRKQNEQTYKQQRTSSFSNVEYQEIKKPRYRFSEQYQKKLEQKRQFLNKSLEKRMLEGYQLLQQQKKRTQKNKLNKMLNQSRNQVKRRVHFNFMESIKNMKQQNS